MSSYAETHRRSLEDPEGFWAEQAQALHWDQRWDRRPNLPVKQAET